VPLHFPHKKLFVWMICKCEDWYDHIML